MLGLCSKLGLKVRTEDIVSITRSPPVGGIFPVGVSTDGTLGTGRICIVSTPISVKSRKLFDVIDVRHNLVLLFFARVVLTVI